MAQEILTIIILTVGTTLAIYTHQGNQYSVYNPRLTYDTKRDDYPPIQKGNYAPRYAITYVTTPGYSPYVYSRYAAKPRHYYENYKTYNYKNGLVPPQRNFYAKVLPYSRENYNSAGNYNGMKPVDYNHKNGISRYIVHQSNFQPVPASLQPVPVPLQPVNAYRQAPTNTHAMEKFAKSLPLSHNRTPYYRKTKKCYQCAWSPSKTDYITLKDQKVAVASRGGWDKCKGPFSKKEAKSYGLDVWECQDNCYLRVDHNGNFFRGCYKGEYGVDPKKLGCNYQANSLYCFCDSDRCNNGPLPRHKIYS